MQALYQLSYTPIDTKQPDWVEGVYLEFGL
jgi:hypothetical protein